MAVVVMAAIMAIVFGWVAVNQIDATRVSSTPLVRQLVPDTDGKVISQQLRTVANADISYATLNGVEPVDYSALAPMPPTFNSYGQISLGTDLTGLNGSTMTRYVCMTQTIRPYDYKAYFTAERLAPGVTFLSGAGACGAKANTKPSWSGKTATIALTYWFTPPAQQTSQTSVDVSTCYSLILYANGSIYCSGYSRTPPSWCSNSDGTQSKSSSYRIWGPYYGCYLPSGTQCDVTTIPITCSYSSSTSTSGGTSVPGNTTSGGGGTSQQGGAGTSSGTGNTSSCTAQGNTDAANCGRSSR